MAKDMTYPKLDPVWQLIRCEPREFITRAVDLYDLRLGAVPARDLLATFEMAMRLFDAVNASLADVDEAILARFDRAWDDIQAMKELEDRAAAEAVAS